MSQLNDSKRNSMNNSRNTSNRDSLSNSKRNLSKESGFKNSIAWMSNV